MNDNFGRWQSNFHTQVEHCLEDGVRGRELVEELRPEADDYFVLKPKHSGFFSTTLDILLEYLGAKTLILTGIAGNICVLFTANDAYLRDFGLIVPRDAVASNTEEENDHALEQMAKILKADTHADDGAGYRGPRAERPPSGVPPRPRSGGASEVLRRLCRPGHVRHPVEAEARGHVQVHRRVGHEL